VVGHGRGGRLEGLDGGQMTAGDTNGERVEDGGGHDGLLEERDY